MLLSLPVFGYVWKFCADKIATSYVFEGYLTTSSDCRQSHMHAEVPRPAVECPKKCLKTQIFFQHCESLLFLAVCFLKI